MNVPFLDLKSQYAAMRDEMQAAIAEVCEQAAYAGGPFVEKFEWEFAAYCKSRFAVGVGNGTDALWLALLALGIGRGDEVITVPNTFIATAEAISLSGATPVFVDVDPVTYTMDPRAIQGAVTPRTKAIIPVHLFGQTADMDPILDVAREHGLHVIEDAAQAHGADYKGRVAGSMGALGCFSFYPGKNLGAYGEAGAVVTGNDELARKMRIFRDHGQPKKYMHSIIGWNARMDGIQGNVLRVKLKKLDAANEARRRHAKVYDELLAGAEGIVPPTQAGYAKHVYHIYAVRVQHRDAVLAALAAKDIHAAIHYPVPLHLQEAYVHLGFARGAFPVAERCAGEFLSLPMFPELTEEQIRYVADGLRQTVSASGAAARVRA